LQEYGCGLKYNNIAEEIGVVQTRYDVIVVGAGNAAMCAAMSGAVFGRIAGREAGVYARGAR